jgi:hypothetical protein
MCGVCLRCTALQASRFVAVAGIALMISSCGGSGLTARASKQEVEALAGLPKQLVLMTSPKTPVIAFADLKDNDIFLENTGTSCYRC